MLHQQSGNGGGPLSTEAGVLHIDAQGNLGVLLGRKSDEDRVVLARFVLHGSGLAAQGDAIDAGPAGRTRAVLHHLAHRPDDGLEVDGIHTGFHANAQSRGLAFFADTADEVGRAVPAAVGQYSRKVGHLERGGQQFTFANGDGVYGAKIPTALAVDAIIIAAARYVARRGAG